jgi:1,4-alpha-glucan branching enzyme
VDLAHLCASCFVDEARRPNASASPFRTIQVASLLSKAELTGEIRRAGGRRKMIVLGENEPQDSVLLRPLEEGGHGMDAVWNDDFHHSARVALTGKREAYYTEWVLKKGLPRVEVASN